MEAALTLFWVSSFLIISLLACRDNYLNILISATFIISAYEFLIDQSSAINWSHKKHIFQSTEWSQQTRYNIHLIESQNTHFNKEICNILVKTHPNIPKYHIIPRRCNSFQIHTDQCLVVGNTQTGFPLNTSYF